MKFDPAKRRAETEAMLKEQAKSARTVVCGEDAIEGRPHDTYDADFGDSKVMGFSTKAKYWIDRATGQTTKTISTMTGTSIMSKSTQRWQPDATLTLPVPN